MVNERWNYQVVEIKPSFLGKVTTEAIQSELSRLGAQGWELVASTSGGGSGWLPLRLILKRAQ